ncbi:MAG: nitrous oxide reductase accessory protein NosL [Candidatus Binatia bacterium]
MKRAVAGVTVAVALVVAAVVFLWPGPRTGSEVIAYGRDTCAYCRMHLSQPGWAGEMRDAEGQLTKYDDIGCLLQAMLKRHREIPEAWVEDHASGRLVPLLGAYLVRAPGATTPMGHGLVAFGDEESAHGFADAKGGEVVRLEDLLREPQRWAQGPESKGSQVQ